MAKRLVVCVFLLCFIDAAGAEEIETDLLVVGGTESGWAATIQAARMGVESITLVNDIEWLGGQFNAEAVGAIDENRGVEAQVPFPRSGLFAELTEKIEQSNLERYGHRQPGNAWTARTTIRPAEAAAIFREMIDPYVRSGQIRLISHYYPVAAALAPDGHTLQTVHFRSSQNPEAKLSVRARLTIDASDWGDVIQASGAAFEYGPDPRTRYGEPNAPMDPVRYPLTDMNPITYTLVITETGDGQPIPKPEHFDDRKYYLTSDATKQDYLALPWPFPPHRPFNPPWTPLTGTYYQGDRSVYSQRRLIDHYNLKIDHPDVISLVWTIQDYPLDVLPRHVAEALDANEPGASKKNIVVMNRQQRQIVFEDAKQHSLGMLYHLQTTVHERMKDKGHSFRRFALTDEFGTADRCPPKPYVRESLRLKAMYMMREQDTRHFEHAMASATPYQNSSKGSKSELFARAMYYDAVAGWQFPYDFHMTGRMFLHGDRSGPWASFIKPGRSWRTLSDRAVFPLRSLIPERIDGLLGAQKNLGYSSIVSSAVRLHDQSIAIGQASGAAAAVALKRGIQPRTIPYDLNLLSEVQRELCQGLDGGVAAMLWPFRDIAPDHVAYRAANLLAAHQLLPLERDGVDFRPSAPATSEWRKAIVRRSRTRFVGALEAPADPKMTRGDFARRWWETLEALPQVEIPRVTGFDSDDDGLPDQDDASPFDGNGNNLMDFMESEGSPLTGARRVQP